MVFSEIEMELAKMTPNEIAEAARKKIQDAPEMEKILRDMWDQIKSEISAKALASPKKWKVYEVHQIECLARLELLTAFVEGSDLGECERRARVTLWVIDEGHHLFAP